VRKSSPFPCSPALAASASKGSRSRSTPGDPDAWRQQAPRHRPANAARRTGHDRHSLGFAHGVVPPALPASILLPTSDFQGEPLEMARLSGLKSVTALSRRDGGSDGMRARNLRGRRSNREPAKPGRGRSGNRGSCRRPLALP
jgi:hypothetical protein